MADEADLDFAFELQLQEAINESLTIQPQILDDDFIVDFETLELLQKFEEERKDAEQWEAEIHKIQFDLKRHVHDQKFAREILQIPEETWEKDGDNIMKPFEEGSSSSASSSSSSTQAVRNDGLPFRLYFKGLCSDDGEGSLAAIGAAVCDPTDNLILNVQKPLLGDWKGDLGEEDFVLKVEVKALVDGLTAALTLDIKKIDFFCDYYPLFQYITNRSLITQQKIVTIVDQVYLLQRKFDSCHPFFVARNDVKFAFKLARDAIDSLSTRSADSSRAKELKETCNICLEDTDVEKMVAVDGCTHRYCLSCMEQHVEVKLLYGRIPRCPHEGCNIQLNIHSCKRYLSPKLIDMMHQHIEEASIPATEKLYCPYPKCSALMSKTQAWQYADGLFIGAGGSGARKCIKCHGLFCINCKVPWHSNMSCREFEKSNPNPDTDAKLKSLATKSLWRQCVKCNHMIELSEGCYHITCRCGYEFCYTCGAEWLNKNATCRCPIWDERNIVNDQVQ